MKFNFFLFFFFLRKSVVVLIFWIYDLIQIYYWRQANKGIKPLQFKRIIKLSNENLIVFHFWLQNKGLLFKWCDTPLKVLINSLL